MTGGNRNRRLSAVLMADIVGYTKLIEQDTDGTVAALAAAQSDVIDLAIDKHAGRIVKYTGDGFLAEFPTVQDSGFIREMRRWGAEGGRNRPTVARARQLDCRGCCGIDSGVTCNSVISHGAQDALRSRGLKELPAQTRDSSLTPLALQARGSP